MEISYEALQREILDILSEHKVWVLATADQRRVSARSMSIVNDGLHLYFQTDRDLLKCTQIEKNPRVALCRDNVSMEGSAEIKGSWQEFNCPAVLTLYQASHQGSFDTYGNMPGEVVIEVKLSLVTLWKYAGRKPYREFLYVTDKKAVRENYPSGNR